MMNKKLLQSFLFTACLFLTVFSGSAQTILAGWDFQTAPGTAILASPNTQTSFTANVGAGTISLDGSNGSSTWLPATELSAFTGTNLNAGGATGLSTTTTSPACLALLGGTANSANGKSLVFSFNMTGYVNLVVSYATQRTGTGFTSQAWEYSTNGTTWTAAQTISSIPAAFAVQTLSTITALDNVATAYLRLTVTGASAAAGNNRLDNIQLNVGNPLPIALSGFTANVKNQSTVLSFSTATETNNAYFSIERSQDGSRFEAIGKVTGAGTSTVKQEYTFTDERPLKGTNFYRLKQVDFDGQFSYSPVVSVNIGKVGGVKLSPQPVLDRLTVALEQPTVEAATWQVYDFAGRLLQSGSVEAESTNFEISTATLTEGSYVLRLVNGQQIITQQFQKN